MLYSVSSSTTTLSRSVDDVAYSSSSSDNDESVRSTLRAAFCSSSQAQREKKWKELRCLYYALDLIKFDPSKRSDTWAKVPLNAKVTMYKMAFDDLKLYPADFEIMMKIMCVLFLCDCLLHSHSY